MDWITQQWDRVSVILTSFLHVPRIITNIISVRKLDLIRCELHNSLMQAALTKKTFRSNPIRRTHVRLLSFHSVSFH